MGDFVVETELEELDERHYQAVLDPAWMTWGPMGGYVASVALRAAGRATHFQRPASFACQYLSVARFEAVDLQVETLRGGRRTEALRVSMTQDGKPVLDAHVWAVDANEGLEHDMTQVPAVPPYTALPNMEELAPDRGPRGFYDNLEHRPVDVRDFRPEENQEAREPVMRGWYRFRPRATAEDRFSDAARAVMLIDAFSWPATWPAHPSGKASRWIAPNLDLHVRFHHDARPHEWLLCETRAELASEGLIGTNGSVWSPDGKLVAAGSSQLFCRPRPERFR